MSATVRYVFGWFLGYLLGLLMLRHARRAQHRRIRDAYCRTVAAAGGLITRPCPGCGGLHGGGS